MLLLPITSQPSKGVFSQIENARGPSSTLTGRFTARAEKLEMGLLTVFP